MCAEACSCDRTPHMPKPGNCAYLLPIWSSWQIHRELAPNKVLPKIEPLLSFDVGSLVPREKCSYHSMQMWRFIPREHEKLSLQKVSTYR